MQVTYQFTYRDGGKNRFTVDIDRAPVTDTTSAPDWTRLDVHRCRNCPLKPDTHSHCPAALDLAPVITSFAPVISHDEARVDVETPERSFSKDCQVQQSLTSLVALIMATSACPILGQMRGLARTHLPFATMEETLFRSASAYLLKQALIQHAGGAPDWAFEGLKALYAELETLNIDFKKRVNAASKQDASINAVATLGVIAMGVGFSIDDIWNDLADLAIPTETNAQI